jgi:hypothetical protein
MFTSTIDLFYDALVILSNSISFPEYAQPLLYSLRKITHGLSPHSTSSKNPKNKGKAMIRNAGGNSREKDVVLNGYIQQVKALVAFVIKNVEYIIKKRSELPGDMYPSNLERLLSLFCCFHSFLFSISFCNDRNCIIRK